MSIHSLVIRNFRNLVSLDVELPERGVIVLGDNGHGKTNFLEAIYYLVLFRSLRGALDRELVHHGSEGFFVAGQNDRRRVQAGYEARGARKRIRLDDAEPERLSDAVGIIRAVAFTPQDREIVSGAPSLRRRYLDVLLSLSVTGYLRHLAAFKAVLRQRNAALRRGRESEARAFDTQFSQHAAVVIAARRSWVEQVQARYRELSAVLGETAAAELEYRPRRDTPETGSDVLAELDRSLARDAALGSTTTGPQRHDLRILLGGRELRHTGSSGQQRTGSLALRLLEAEQLAAATGTPPVGLFDDCFAELDRGRQERLLAVIRESLPGQAIVTAPRESEVPRDLLDLPRWRMRGGRLES